jgi:hypothetical protein
MHSALRRLREFFIEDRELLPEAIVRMPVVKMALAEQAVLFDFDGGDIFGEDQLTTEVTIVDFSEAHMPSFWDRATSSETQGQR